MSSFTKYEQYGAYHWRDIGWKLKYHNPFTAERYRLVLDELSGLPDCGRLLDYGCGDGAFLGLISKKLPDWHLSGFEPSPKGNNLASAQFANRKIKVELFSDRSALAPEGYNVVTCCEVIEHVENPEELLIDLHRICQPEGRVILTSPIRLTEEPLDPEHIKEYFPKELVALCQGSGLFKVSKSLKAIPAGALEAYKFGFIPFAPKLMVANWMKIVSAWFGVNAFRASCPQCDLYSIQILQLTPIRGNL
jgi:2-polyprenyl-3-methyl-5-hydroxy-6-metoxy-1,4-benzoquinol methylase